MFVSSRQLAARMYVWRRATVGLIVVVSLANFLTVSTAPVTMAVAADPHYSEATRPEEHPAAPPPKRATEQQIKAYSGLMALAGIIIAGMALMTLTILWAGRLRRQIRRPLRDIDVPERDFWFLKPPKPTVTKSSLPESHQPPHDPPPERHVEGEQEE